MPLELDEEDYELLGYGDMHTKQEERKQVIVEWKFNKFGIKDYSLIAPTREHKPLGPRTLEQLESILIKLRATQARRQPKVKRQRATQATVKAHETARLNRFNRQLKKLTTTDAQRAILQRLAKTKSMTLTPYKQYILIRFAPYDELLLDRNGNTHPTTRAMRKGNKQ